MDNTTPNHTISSSKPDPSESTASLLTNNTSSYASTTSLISDETITSTTPLRRNFGVKDESPMDTSEAFQGRNGPPLAAAGTSDAVNISKPQQSSEPPPKDYEASFAKLSSSYGFGGDIPTLPRRKEGESKSKSKKSFSLFSTKGK